MAQPWLAGPPPPSPHASECSFEGGEDEEPQQEPPEDEEGGFARAVCGGGQSDGGPVCEDCEASSSFDYRLQSTFGVRICRDCSRKQRHRLLGKTAAKQHFLLSDKDLKGVSFLTKKSTTYQRDGVVHLYLSSQLEPLALAKHGSWAELEEEKERRLAGRATKRAAKRAASAGPSAEDEASPQRVLALRARTSVHVHSFGALLSGSRTCTTCGLVEEVEEM